MDRYVSPAQIATLLGISRRHAYRLIQSMPRVHIGSLVRVAERDLEQFLAARTKHPTGLVAEPAEAPTPTPAWIRPLRLRKR